MIIVDAAKSKKAERQFENIMCLIAQSFEKNVDNGGQ